MGARDLANAFPSAEGPLVTETHLVIHAPNPRGGLSYIRLALGSPLPKPLTTMATSQLSTVPENHELATPIPFVVDELDEVEAITASLLKVDIPSLFGRGSKYETDILFEDLVRFYENLQKAVLRLERTHRAFKNSKKERQNENDVENNNRNNGALNVWSKSDLAQLVDAIESVQQKWLEWENNDNNLLEICSNCPGDKKCWNTQANIAKITNALKTKVTRYNREISKFFDTTGAFRDALLYLDPTWEEIELASGYPYIVSKSDPSQKFWVTRHDAGNNPRLEIKLENTLEKV